MRLSSIPARMAPVSFTPAWAAIQARTRSTVPSLGDAPRRSLPTKGAVARGLRAQHRGPGARLLQELLHLAPERRSHGRKVHVGQDTVGRGQPHRASARLREHEAGVAQNFGSEAPGAHSAALQKGRNGASQNVVQGGIGVEVKRFHGSHHKAENRS